MTQYSFLQLAAEALAPHRRVPALKQSELKSRYDVVIVGGGGHGLATAYYLAREHGITDIAVIERGWLGGGNTGRNTTIVRADYLLSGNVPFFGHALGMWGGLSRELNFNVMFSPRGYLDLAHSEGQFDHFTRRANVLSLNGIGARMVDVEELRRLEPALSIGSAAPVPVLGGLVQDGAGTARHDAVAWGYARGAARLGVDIVQGCEVLGFDIEGNSLRGVKTSAGSIRTDTAVVSVAGNSSRVAEMAGLELPIESYAVQAFVSEPLKPILHRVTNMNLGFAYASQTDKGEIVMGGNLEPLASYAQRGSPLRISELSAKLAHILPFLSRSRLMRVWGGIADITTDGSALVGPSPVSGLHLNAGWGYSGFKATPAAGWCMAHSVATGKVHPLIEPFGYERFASGAFLDEGGSGPYPWLH
ncbi:MAG: FAD-dependent oxidoreductase [Alphaproteobacteria bacterium]|nr:FAD-dependent oxidoreductase [Rhodospirillaceae bacterium]MBT6512361.1 FAD-dependent oxidoreductase [Rhodospirillaceae bacterium]MBT7611830.1 FAD-dependent oxidoreductase [Rhodospirillaceae bacterium]MDG2479997.1 FAD-dependent oxidoreductase [Alphaproteobacteria bacterium]